MKISQPVRPEAAGIGLTIVILISKKIYIIRLPIQIIFRIFLNL